MLEKGTFDFLKQLKKNNNKAWFDAHRAQYEAAKENIIEIASYAVTTLGKLDSRYAELEPKKCLFRIHRDVRFSKNKDLYKTNIGAAFSIGGKKDSGGGFYIHIEPGASFIGGGIWQPAPEHLKKIRQELDYHQNDFLAIVEGKKFKSVFGKLDAEGSLARPPKGYDPEHPLVEYLKLKNYIAGKPISDEIMMSKGLRKEITTCFETMNPLIDFIEKAITD